MWKRCVSYINAQNTQTITVSFTVLTQYLFCEHTHNLPQAERLILYWFKKQHLSLKFILVISAIYDLKSDLEGEIDFKCDL
jgi:hypothetical protein